MTALLASELLRMRSRRMVWVLFGAALIGICLATVIVAVKSHKVTPADRLQAHSLYEQELQSCVNDMVPSLPPSELGGLTPIEFCTKSGTGFGIESENGILMSVAHTYSPVNLADTLLHSSFLVIVMAMLIGASSIGAEWSAGTVTTLLAWEPRRVRALLVRMLAVVITVALITVLLLALLCVGLYGAAVLRGTTEGREPLWLHHLLATIGRITFVATLVSTIGLAVATVGRGTAAALGVLVGYLALFESLLRGLRPTWTPWLLASSVVTYLSGHRAMVDLPDGHILLVSVTHSLIVTCVYSLAIFLIALVVFRQRDVT